MALSSWTVIHFMCRVCRHAQEGGAALMSGVQPRTMWISIGGFVFFGAYETTKRLLFSEEE